MPPVGMSISTPPPRPRTWIVPQASTCAPKSQLVMRLEGLEVLKRVRNELFHAPVAVEGPLCRGPERDELHVGGVELIDHRAEVPGPTPFQYRAV